MRTSLTPALLLATLVAGSAHAGPPARPVPPWDKYDTCVDLVVTRVQPTYPSRLIAREIQGWVELTFKLDGSGVASDITILDSEPRDTFVKTTVSALTEWTFRKGEIRGQCYFVAAFDLRN